MGTEQNGWGSMFLSSGIFALFSKDRRWGQGGFVLKSSRMSQSTHTESGCWAEVLQSQDMQSHTSPWGH